MSKDSQKATVPLDQGQPVDQGRIYSNNTATDASQLALCRATVHTRKSPPNVCNLCRHVPTARVNRFLAYDIQLTLHLFAAVNPLPIVRAAKMLTR